jgi:hypothetical protein
LGCFGVRIWLVKWFSCTCGNQAVRCCFVTKYLMEGVEGVDEFEVFEWIFLILFNNLISDLISHGNSHGNSHVHTGFKLNTGIRFPVVTPNPCSDSWIALEKYFFVVFFW